MTTMRDIVHPVVLNEGVIKFIYLNSLEASLFDNNSARVLMERLDMTNFDLIFRVNGS